VEDILNIGHIGTGRIEDALGAVVAVKELLKSVFDSLLDEVLLDAEQTGEKIRVEAGSPGALTGQWMAAGEEEGEAEQAKKRSGTTRLFHQRLAKRVLNNLNRFKYRDEGQKSQAKNKPLCGQDPGHARGVIFLKTGKKVVVFTL